MKMLNVKQLVKIIRNSFMVYLHLMKNYPLGPFNRSEVIVT